MSHESHESFGLCVALVAILVVACVPCRVVAGTPAGDFAVPSPDAYMAGLKISVDPARPRTFLYTNKRATYYAGMTSADNRSPNQGLKVFGRKVLEDYTLAVDGTALARSSAVAVDVYPYAIVRRYASGVVEETALLDGLDAIVVTVTAPSAHAFAFAPVLAGGSRVEDFAVSSTETRVVASSDVGGDIEQKAPRTVVALACAPGRARVAAAGPVTLGFAPGAVAVASAREACFAIAVGSDRTAALALADRVSRDAAALVAARKLRIARLLLDTYVETADPRFDRALAWLKASGDALVTEQAGPGIWAGLYWFDNYWGRDTFISLPGISLVTGRLDDARRILESFARFQKTDEKDPLYGRIPNRVNSPTDVIYNTADGTPWFVREAFEYVLYSGDLEFARRIYPAVLRATDGTIRFRTDENGLLTHGDQDTWMDAQWEGRVPWSPRGDRAVEVEALWFAQLEASARLAHLVGDKEAAERWERQAARVKRAFRELYPDPASGALVDHLNADGSRDTQVRPNQVLALTVPFEPLVTLEVGKGVVRQVVNDLTYPYGVASLWQRDPNFHPFHHDERWHFDSAYHNGTVWVWNAGPVVAALSRYHRQDLAYDLTRAMVDQTLDLGAVGTLSELIDAIPRDGRLTLSGTETQAWSIGEFVRVFYQSYLGVRVDAVAEQLALDPALPKALGTVHAVVPYRDGRVKVTMEQLGGGRTRCVLYAEKLAAPIEVVFGAPGPQGMMEGSESATLGPHTTLDRETRRPALAPAADPGVLAFAKPEIVPRLKALAGEPTPVVRATAADMVAREPSGATVLYDANDPEGDDRGPNGTYTYPTDAHYEPGMLDLTGVRVAADAGRYYFTLRFRHLVDPGWHPELGFQLTFAAIAVDSDRGAGVVEVGKAAGFALPASLAYERVVYVGGAIEIADATGKPLVTYSPATSEGAFGDARTGEIRFSVPREFLGEWSPAWRFSVVAGGQDDGGAAGLGVFRAVRRTAAQWAGGGADSDEGASRVYDAIIPPP